MSTNTAELPVRGTGQMAVTTSAVQAGRRQTLTLGGLYSFRMPSYIQGWPQNYIASSGHNTVFVCLRPSRS